MKIREAISQFKALAGIMHGSRAFGGPYQANLSMTRRCNIRCVHCFFHSPLLKTENMFRSRNAKTPKEELSDEKLMERARMLDADGPRTRELIHELAAMGTRQLTFTGDGEPFLHPDIVDFMRIAKRNGCYCMVNTNGTLIDPPLANELIGLSIDELKITTMAGTPEMYVTTHPGSNGADFDSLTDYLLYIAERKKELGLKRPIVNLIFISVAMNFDHIDAFVAFGLRVGADRLTFRPIDDIRDSGLAQIVPSEEQSRLLIHHLLKAKTLLKAHGTSHNIDYFSKAYSRQLDTKRFYRHVPCYYGWLQPRIEINGAVHACCRCQTSLGNIYQKSFHEIWYGQPYQRFRRHAIQINTGRDSVPDCDCDRCPHYAANLKVYQRVHPIRGQSAVIRNLVPECMAGVE